MTDFDLNREPSYLMNCNVDDLHVCAMSEKIEKIEKNWKKYKIMMKVVTKDTFLKLTSSIPRRAMSHTGIYHSYLKE